jgi:curli production assembly/transport component CsgG
MNSKNLTNNQHLSQNNFMLFRNKQNLISKLIRLSTFIATVVITGCSTTSEFTTVERKATIAATTENYLELKALPKPMGSIPVSVYSFRDQTGQYKPSSTVSSFSTAVSQGASSMLIQALTNTDWFVPLEREGLQNILTERKIIRAAQKNDKQNANLVELPPLQTSSIILEGGITSYESNTETGGFGVGYFGYNASQLYRKDDVTVYLRAVDVRSGRVLLSVSTTKSILSEEIRAGLFRYVSLTRLAELETGFSTNEPVQTALLKAIQKAVTDLVLEGIDKGVWQAANAQELENSKILQDYRNEKKGIINELKKMLAEREASQE